MIGRCPLCKSLVSYPETIVPLSTGRFIDCDSPCYARHHLHFSLRTRRWYWTDTWDHSRVPITRIDGPDCDADKLLRFAVEDDWKHDDSHDDLDPHQP